LQPESNKTQPQIMTCRSPIQFIGLAAPARIPKYNRA
jgi:hypothetical protein